MTIQEAIAVCDALRPNQYPRELKIRWLSKLDGQIYRELLETHADCAVACMPAYDEGADDDTVLLVPEPYAMDIYNYYLQAQIDKENGEITKFNQSIVLYNSAYQSYVDHYHRSHMPVSMGKRFVF